MKEFTAWLLFCIIFALNSCKNDRYFYLDRVLPTNNSLTLKYHDEHGITSYYVYHIDGDLNFNSFKYFPKIDKYFKAVVTWHRITDEELKDLKKLIAEQQNHSLAKQLLNSINRDDFYLSIIYNRNRYPLGSKSYNPVDWQDIILLNESERKLYVIQYGKF